MPTSKRVVRWASNRQTLGVVTRGPSVLKFLVHSLLQLVVNFV